VCIGSAEGQRVQGALAGFGGGEEPAIDEGEMSGGEIIDHFASEPTVQGIRIRQ
jgi:hypothetical protein